MRVFAWLFFSLSNLLSLYLSLSPFVCIKMYVHKCEKEEKKCSNGLCAVFFYFFKFLSFCCCSILSVIGLYVIATFILINGIDWSEYRIKFVAAMTIFYFLLSPYSLCTHILYTRCTHIYINESSGFHFANSWHQPRCVHRKHIYIHTITTLAESKSKVSVVISVSFVAVVVVVAVAMFHSCSYSVKFLVRGLSAKMQMPLLCS